MMITTCIFDFDGTLVNSLEDLADTTNILLEKYGYSTHPLEAYRKFVGNGIDRLLQRAFKNEDKQFLKTIRKEFDSLYQIHNLRKTKPYTGIIELLETLEKKGIKLAVVTNKAHDIANTMVNTVFPNTFLYTYGGSSEYPHKPDPTMVYHVMERLHSKPEECVFIGDSDVDILTGKNANIKTIGVTWGFRKKEELVKHKADAIADIPKEIGVVIDDWSK